jgi:carbonic anhydrase
MLPNTPPQESQQVQPFPRFTPSTPISSLLDRNRAWAERQEKENPLLFPSLEHSQHPQILWIGCSDSRVPETTVLDLLPGDIFVHRNIANVVSAGDLSVLSVVQFAVEVLKVNHIVVCGKLLSDGADTRTLWMWWMYRCAWE